MPETQQADPVSQFQSLPRERQTALLKKMSPEQKQKLKAGIDKKLAAKQQAKPASAPEEGIATKVGRGAAIGVAEGLGIKPATSAKEVLTGTAKQFASGVTGLVKDTWEANKHNPVTTALDIIPSAIDRAATSLEEGGKQTYQDIKNKDWEAAAEHGASTLTQALMLKEAKEGKGVLSKDSLTSISKQGTQAVIQKFVHDRALGIQDHLAEVQKSVKAEDAARWQHLEGTIDTAKPNGAIDLSAIRQATQGNVDQTIKAPQKLPASVSEMNKGQGSLKTSVGTLDPSNAAHAALIQRLKEAGALPDEDSASFAKVRQMRSKLGRELRSGSSSLSGESKSVGWKLYADYTNAMKNAAEEHGMAGSFEDANKFHAKYMDHWGPDSVLGKAIEGTNAHDVLSDLSGAKHAEEIKRVMEEYRGHGLDPDHVTREGKLFQKLGSGLPQQLPFSRWEALTYAVKPTAGPLYTGSREAFNWYKRDKAISEVKKPNPVAVRAQSLKAAAEKLGPKASVKEIMAEADKAQQ